jgi:hypothetical protein
MVRRSERQVSAMTALSSSCTQHSVQCQVVHVTCVVEQETVWSCLMADVLSAASFTLFGGTVAAAATADGQ